VLGLVTRLATIPLLIDICAAIVLTKIHELRSGGFGGVAEFWGMAHDARTDFAMLLGLIFLRTVGTRPLVSGCQAGPRHIRVPVTRRTLSRQA
jgi:hypothetical protein